MHCILHFPWNFASSLDKKFAKQTEGFEKNSHNNSGNLSRYEALIRITENFLSWQATMQMCTTQACSATPLRLGAKLGHSTTQG